MAMIHCAMTREYLTEVYLDWRNNYLSAEVFAEHHGLYPEEAKILIELSRKVFDAKHHD